MKTPWIEELDKEFLKTEIPAFGVGDTINLHLEIIEGDKKRIQQYSGVVIARKGRGISETFSLYKIAAGCPVERVFMLHSPKITKIEIEKRGHVRRAKLYYLRGKTGKAARVSDKKISF